MAMVGCGWGAPTCAQSSSSSASSGCFFNKQQQSVSLIMSKKRSIGLLSTMISRGVPTEAAAAWLACPSWLAPTSAVIQDSMSFLVLACR